jgi:site-specific recombinase XerC
MTREKRLGLSAVQTSDLWRRWKAGQSLHEIGRAFGKEHSSIRCLVSRHGGFVPLVRRRSLRTLTLGEREDISRGIASGCSMRDIAKDLQRVASTRAVQDALGHKSVSTTVRYSHRAPDFLRAVVDNLVPKPVEAVQD